jgi:predicted esterase
MFRLRSSAISSILPLFVFFLLSLLCNIAQAQDYCPWPATAMKQKKVASIKIPGTDLIHGYLEKLPDDYNNTNKKYPLLIFFHGVNETGQGTSAHLCRLLSEWWWTPSTLGERASNPVFPSTVTDQYGQTQKFILISAQLEYFGDANTSVNALITYLLNRYRADPSRVYLTGISAGANFVSAYASASESNARRIAALLSVAPCGWITSQGALNMAKANLPFWSFQCIDDKQCGGNTASNQANLINSQNPAPTPLAQSTTFPVPNYPCTQNVHEIWGTVYNQTFRQNINGRNVNVYEWLVQYSRAALLPVKLENYSVQLKDGKVSVRWATSAENNNAGFTIERSGDGRRFTEVAVIPAVGNTTGKTYQWMDERPLTNLSYYRLVQTDLNGHKEYFQVKRIMNRSLFDRSLVVAPNPFTTELAAFINVPRTQQVTISITDISGRVLKTAYGKYAEGAAEFNMNTTSLPKGIYFLKVKGEDFTQIQKIVKQ